MKDYKLKLIYTDPFEIHFFAIIKMILFWNDYDSLFSLIYFFGGKRNGRFGFKFFAIRADYDELVEQNHRSLFGLCLLMEHKAISLDLLFFRITLN